MNKARTEFYCNFIEENSCDQRLFRASKRLFNQPQDGFPSTLHASTFANNFGKYFMVKINKIQKQIDSDCAELNVPLSTNVVTDKLCNESVPLQSQFKVLTESDVRKLIHHSSLKTPCHPN